MTLLDRWEYHVAELDLSRWPTESGGALALERALNAIGDDGWELVSTVRRKGLGSYDERLACIFKRPRPA